MYVRVQRHDLIAMSEPWAWPGMACGAGSTPHSTPAEDSCCQHTFCTYRLAPAIFRLAAQAPRPPGPVPAGCATACGRAHRGACRWLLTVSAVSAVPRARHATGCRLDQVPSRAVEGCLHCPSWPSGPFINQCAAAVEHQVCTPQATFEKGSSTTCGSGGLCPDYRSTSSATTATTCPGCVYKP